MMIFKPFTIIDKIGNEVILRNAEEDDAESLIKYLQITTSETPYLTREPDEAILSLGQEQDFIQKIIDSDRELMLVAVTDGKLIGNCSLMGNGPYRRYRHRCHVAIALYQEYCGRGIGTMMLQAILQAAKEIGYEQAELVVAADNKKAIALYENLGFERYGYFPCQMKYQNGQYADAYWMMKKLSRYESVEEQQKEIAVLQEMIKNRFHRQ